MTRLLQELLRNVLRRCHRLACGFGREQGNDNRSEHAQQETEREPAHNGAPFALGGHGA
jgi:hypothetical protein